MFTEAKLIIAAVGLSLSVLVSAWITHRIDETRYLKLQAGYAQAQIAAQEKTAQKQKFDEVINHADAILASLGRQRIVTNTFSIIQEVPRYVHQTSFVGCIPYGFVRVLNAQVLGVSPGDLQLAAGVTDDTCYPLDPTAVANSIIANYGNAKQNADQLNGLEANITSRADQSP